MMCAQELSIEIKESKPSLRCDEEEGGDIWRHSPFVIKTSSGIHMLAKSDMVTAVILLVENVKGAAHSFMESVHDSFSSTNEHDVRGILIKLKANAPLLVAQFRNLSNTTSHFLNAIEEICQSQQGNTKSLILLNAKQPIYSAMGSLFVVSQTITNSNLDAIQVTAAYHRLEQCMLALETSLQDVIDVTTNHMDEILNEEKELVESGSRHTSTPTPPVRQYSNGSSRHYISSPVAQPMDATTTTAMDDEDILSEEGVNRRNEIGLNTLMSNPSVHSGFMLENESDTSSFHSDMMLNHVRPAKEAKIAKFFGEDTMEAARRRDTVTTMPSHVGPLTPGGTAIHSGMTGADMPWFLVSDVSSSDMMFNMEGNVKGGSLHGLIQRLTQHDQLGKIGYK